MNKQQHSEPHKKRKSKSLIWSRGGSSRVLRALAMVLVPSPAIKIRIHKSLNPETGLRSPVRLILRQTPEKIAETSFVGIRRFSMGDKWEGDEVARHLHKSKIWMDGNLRERDLLIIGFWTDWCYLNKIIGDALTDVAPAVNSRPKSQRCAGKRMRQLSVQHFVNARMSRRAASIKV